MDVNGATGEPVKAHARRIRIDHTAIAPIRRSTTAVEWYVLLLPLLLLVILIAVLQPGKEVAPMSCHLLA